jgi:tetratricopeptide (TPR) repeat protein
VKESEAAFRDALAVYKTAATDFPESHRFRYYVSANQMDLAHVLRMTRRLKEAEGEIHGALVLMKQLVAEFPDNAEFCYALGTIQHQLSLLLTQNKRWPEAETAIRAALAVHEPLIASSPTRADFRHILAKDYKILGFVLRHLDRLSEAGDVYRKALPLLKQLANDSPSRPAYQAEVANALCGLALVSTAKEPEQARRLLEEALLYSQVALKADPGNIDYLATLYQTYEAQADVFLQLRDHAGAAAAAEAAEPACHTPDDIYEFVCGYADCVKLAGEDVKLSEARRKELCKSYGDRAMNALRRAVQFGYKDVDKLKKDKHLDPLRGRDDFKKLLTDLQKPAR